MCCFHMGIAQIALDPTPQIVSFVQLITQYKLIPVVLWEIEPDLGKFVALILDNFTQAQKYFTQMSLVLLATNSMYALL